MDWHSRRDSLGYGTQENDAANPPGMESCLKKLGLDADWTVLGDPERDARSRRSSRRKHCTRWDANVCIFSIAGRPKRKFRFTARTAVDGGLGEVVQAVRDGTAAALRAGRSLAAAFRAADRAERDLAAAHRAALGATEMLGRGLQEARREVAPAVELMQQQGRQRGPEGDYGPSR